jgi:hypothetical protein
MSYTYLTYRSALQTLVVSQDPDPDFDAILPSAIDYAEMRIYRELDLISTVVVDESSLLTNGTRVATINNAFVTVDNINVLTPAGSTGATGERQTLIPVSRALLDSLWPGNSVTGLPVMFSMVDQWTMILGPCPDAGYFLEVVGTQRPTPLSASNTSTFLTARLPDLFMAASMIFMSGYMRNFGAQQNDPAMSSSWEAQYQNLKASADAEELRKHFWASSWSSQPISNQAQPQRG